MKHVTIVVPNGYADLSSMTGTFDILTRANDYWQKIGQESKMELHIAGFVTELKLEVGIFSIHPENIREIGITDLVIIPSVGDYFNHTVEENPALIAWIREQYNTGAEIASICTGAFLLAATGLLKGKACSTHWAAETEFRRQFPDVHLQTDKLLTVDQGIYTNGGSYSFLHLVLLLVEKYFDRQTAIVCSKMFQIDMDRSLQSPFIIFQKDKDHGDELVCKAQTYIEENLTEKISFEDLASKLAISRRNFDRRFTKAVGNTPVEYLQRVRTEVAKSSLEKGRKSIFEVMNEVGYADDKAFREVFKRITGYSPLEYRARFTKRAIPA
jgi:transcriptional regulator GlxA family with amidase domain